MNVRAESNSPLLLEMFVPVLREVGTSLPSGAVTVQVRVKASSGTYRVRSSLLLRVTCCPLVTTSPLAAVVAATMAEPMPAMTA